jgi:hypothetical protein
VRPTDEKLSGETAHDVVVLVYMLCVLQAMVLKSPGSFSVCE